jgi:hypothetical protein
MEWRGTHEHATPPPPLQHTHARTRTHRVFSKVLLECNYVTKHVNVTKELSKLARVCNSIS